MEARKRKLSTNKIMKDFDISTSFDPPDFLFGEEGEKMLLKALYESTIEVKRDRFTADTRNIAVEYECRGKPSGISTTKADWWAFIISGKAKDRMVIFIETERLKFIARVFYKLGHVKDVGDDKQSKVVLIPYEKLL